MLSNACSRCTERLQRRVFGRLSISLSLARVGWPAAAARLSWNWTSGILWSGSVADASFRTKGPSSNGAAPSLRRLGRNSEALPERRHRVRQRGLPHDDAEAPGRRRSRREVGVLRLAVEIVRARELVTAAARGAHRAPNDHRRCDGTDTVQREQALESMFAARSSQTPTRVARKGAAP